MCTRDDYPPYDLPTDCAVRDCRNLAAITAEVRCAGGTKTVGVCTQHANPKPELALSAMDGNAFAILGAGKQVLRAAGYPKEDIAAFLSEATNGDYDALLMACFDWFTVS